MSARQKRGSFLKYVILVLSSLIGTGILLEFLCKYGFISNRASEVYLRSRAHSSAGLLKVLIIGDSFSADDPTLPSFASLLRQYLEQNRANVINISLPGHGPPDYLDNLKWFRIYAPDYRPDLVIVNYYIGNDLTDTISRWHGVAPRVQLFNGAIGSLLQRSYLVQTLMEIRQNLLERRHRRTIVEQITTRNADRNVARNPFLADLSSGFPQYLEESLLLASDEARRAWKKNEQIFKEFKDYAQKHESKFLIQILPHTLQVNRNHYEFFKNLGFNMDERYLTSTIPQEQFHRFCRQEEIFCHDLLPGFKQKTSGEFFIDRDDHWNVDGHQVAYELSRKAIEKSGLLTKR